MERSRLSSWRAMLSKFQNKKNKLTRQVNQLTRDIRSLDKKMTILELKIADLKSQDIKICQHALDRYRERFNPEATDQEIYDALITEELREAVGTLGNLIYTVEGKEMIIKDNILVTIYDPKDKKYNKG